MCVSFDVDRELCAGHNAYSKLLGSHVRADQAVHSVTIGNGNCRKTKRMCAFD
jgi:hypothetical protein